MLVFEKLANIVFQLEFTILLKQRDQDCKKKYGVDQEYYEGYQQKIIMAKYGKICVHFSTNLYQGNQLKYGQYQYFGSKYESMEKQKKGAVKELQIQFRIVINNLMDCQLINNNIIDYILVINCYIIYHNKYISFSQMSNTQLIRQWNQWVFLQLIQNSARQNCKARPFINIQTAKDIMNWKEINVHLLRFIIESQQKKYYVTITTLQNLKEASMLIIHAFWNSQIWNINWQLTDYGYQLLWNCNQDHKEECLKYKFQFIPQCRSSSCRNTYLIVKNL